MINPYACKSLEENITNLKNLVSSTMTQVQNLAVLNGIDISDEEFQKNVNILLDESLNGDFVEQFSSSVGVWTRMREGVIKKYMASRAQDISEILTKKKQKFEIKRYLKIATKCNSEGGNDVLEKDLSPWLDRLYKLISEPADKKFLKDTATRKRALKNLYRMIAFPISVKETEIVQFGISAAVNNEIIKGHLSENDIRTLISKHPDIYLPDSALKSQKSISDLLVVSSNMLRFYSPDGKVIHQLEGRLKSSEAQKWTKYIVGIRDEPHYDGIGVMEVVPATNRVFEASKSINNKNDKVKIDHRYPIDLNNVKSVPKDVHLNIRKIAEKAIINLLKNTYFDRKGNLLSTDEMNALRKNMIYGDWVDFNVGDTSSPLEAQIKGEFAHQLYSFNSPFGHNSAEYNSKRGDEWMKKVDVSGKKFGVNTIADNICYSLVLPAFLSQDRI